MHDELEFLKKDWQKQTKEMPKLTAEEIYPMLQKTSLSIVKWVFIISIMEFSFWILCSVFLRDMEYEKFEESDVLHTFEKYFLIIHLSFLMVFMIWFYLSFKKINAVDSAKTLIHNIFKTRKTVLYYMYISFALFVVAALVTVEEIVNNNPERFGTENPIVFFAMTTLIIVLLATPFWLLYRLIYGRLMRKLTNNYKELKKLED